MSFQYVSSAALIIPSSTCNSPKRVKYATLSTTFASSRSNSANASLCFPPATAAVALK